MPQILAYRDKVRRRWIVPVGSVVHDEIKDCDHCGHGVNVLTVATADGSVVMADDMYDRADEESTICRRCIFEMGPDE